jgi:hypothetical protein
VRGDHPPRVKPTGDFGNAIEGTRIGNRLRYRVFAKKSAVSQLSTFATQSPESDSRREKGGLS